MNRAEHHTAAEKLVAAAGDIQTGDTVTGYTRQLVLMATAQVHATLASGVLAEGEPAPRSGGTYDQTARSLIEINDLRGSLENAEQSRRLAEGLLKTARGQRDELQDRIGRALAAISAVNPMPDSPMGRVGAILEGPPRAERVLPPGYRPQYAAPDEQSGVTWKDCTLDGVPIPNTDGTPNKYAEPQVSLPKSEAFARGESWPVPSDGPGQ